MGLEILDLWQDPRYLARRCGVLFLDLTDGKFSTSLKQRSARIRKLQVELGFEAGLSLTTFKSSVSHFKGNKQKRCHISR